MTKESIREAVLKLPFRPFTVRLADGRHYEVLSSDHASVSPSGRTLIIWGKGDEMKWLDVALILELETTEAA